MHKGADNHLREAASRAEAAGDARYVALAQRGDVAAFRHLFERYRQRAFMLALGILGDQEEARDMVQEGFVRAYKNLSSFSGASSFYTWLYRIVMNLCIDHKRRAKRLKVDDFAEQGTSEGAIALEALAFADQPLGFDPRRALLNGEIRARIEAALGELSEAHRTVLILREIDGLSYEELADVMGCSKGTIMSRLFHARKNMQAKLADLAEVVRSGEDREYSSPLPRHTEEP